jgi:dUTP pyrophosphatase
MSYTLFIKFADTITDSEKKYYSEYKTKHEGDSGIDLVNSSTFYVESLKVGTIDFKIQCEMINEKGELVSYYLYPRSSISKTPLMMANSVGIIDAGYRGNIMAKVRNMSNIDTLVTEGEKLFQICSPTLDPIKIKIVEKLTDSSRGNGGFGSTGK